MIKLLNRNNIRLRQLNTCKFIPFIRCISTIKNNQNDYKPSNQEIFRKINNILIHKTTLKDKNY